jgi:hypothetical protein
VGAVSFVTELGNIVTPTDVISDVLGPALVKKVTMMNLMHVEDIPTGTPVKKFRKDGALTEPSATTAESNAVALATGGELSQTSVSATAAKMAISSALSVEEQEWGSVTLADIALKQADAIARGVDTTALSRTSGFSQTVTSSAGLALEDIYLAGYTIDNNEVPDLEVQKAVVISRKARHNLQIQSLQTGASAFVNSQFLSILNDRPRPNNLVASIPGYDIYATSGFATSGGDNLQLVLHPKYGLAGMFAPRPVTWVVNKGTEGLYSESVTYWFFAIVEWYDQACVTLASDQ